MRYSSDKYGDPKDFITFLLKNHLPKRRWVRCRFVYLRYIFVFFIFLGWLWSSTRPCIWPTATRVGCLFHFSQEQIRCLILRSTSCNINDLSEDIILYSQEGPFQGHDSRLLALSKASCPPGHILTHNGRPQGHQSPWQYNIQQTWILSAILKPRNIQPRSMWWNQTYRIRSFHLLQTWKQSPLEEIETATPAVPLEFSKRTSQKTTAKSCKSAVFT